MQKKEKKIIQINCDIDGNACYKRQSQKTTHKEPNEVLI